MPELGEVEYYRKVWNSGLGEKILSVKLNDKKRVFRGTNTQKLIQKLTQAKLLSSYTHGKQMLFQFSGQAWLRIHLGMTGKLLTKPISYFPDKHDHLVLFQKKQTLIFRDPRQFGRIQFDTTKTEPKGWINLPPSILSKKFSPTLVKTFLKRHKRAPIKSVLLLQQGFPGVGNWIADEILWQSQIPPQTPAGSLTEKKSQILFQNIRQIAVKIIKTVGKDFSDPPKTWLFHYRWKKKGPCPRCHTLLKHTTIGGRTTCWCPKCQNFKPSDPH